MKNRRSNITIIQIIKITLMIFFFLSSLILYIQYDPHNEKVTQMSFIKQEELTRMKDQEDCSEDNLYCILIYSDKEEELQISVPYEEYDQQPDKISAYLYYLNGEKFLFAQENPSAEEINTRYYSYLSDKNMPMLDLAVSLFLLGISVLLMTFFSKFFTTYEKTWFLTIMALSALFSYLFPEEDANGINGILIMCLYLADTFLNILCELLISKQSRYNFLVSIGVEIVEILTCIVLRYRFATLAVTLLFWLPIDILSFLSWSNHKDEQQEELTVVRKLSGFQEILIILFILIWTFGVGLINSGISFTSDFFHFDRSLETLIIYLDACASAVGIANGVFIYLRLEEQWIAWYLYSILDGLINILCGQYVLLILKLGFLTNTTYGYLKWKKYIQQHQHLISNDKIDTINR